MTVAELTDLIDEQLASGMPVIDNTRLRLVFNDMTTLEPEGDDSITTVTANINTYLPDNTPITSEMLRNACYAFLQLNPTGNALPDDLVEYINASLPDDSRLNPVTVKKVLIDMLQLINPNGDPSLRIAPKTLVYQIGDGGDSTPNYPITATIAEGDPIIPGNPLLSNILAIRYNNADIENKEENLDIADDFTLDFSPAYPNGFTNGYIWIEVGSGGVSGSGGSSTWVVVSASRTINAGGLYAVDASAGDVTITLGSASVGAIKINRVDESDNILSIVGYLPEFTGGEVRMTAHQEITFTWFGRDSNYLLG